MGKLVANVDDDVKARAAALYDSMGMSLSTAVNMFLRQSLMDNGLPFKPTRHTPDGYPVPPVHNAYMFERSEKGHVILPADWDDSEDDVYDQYANSTGANCCNGSDDSR